jgi:hypothetical protein
MDTAKVTNITFPADVTFQLKNPARCHVSLFHQRLGSTYRTTNVEFLHTYRKGNFIAPWDGLERQRLPSLTTTLTTDVSFAVSNNQVDAGVTIRFIIDRSWRFRRSITDRRRFFSRPADRTGQ